ncbi:MAG: hypothetical protein AAF747_05855 [Planctomycetota bacterium]
MSRKQRFNHFCGAVTSQGAIRLGLAACLAVLVAVSLPLVHVASAVPEPDPVPTRWELDFDAGPMRVAVVPVKESDGSVTDRTFYYFTYQVTNYSSEDLDFVPSFTLATGAGDVQASGIAVPDSVTRSLITRLRDPLLQDQIEIIGTIRRGEAYARSGIVIWPVLDNDPEELTVYAAGFSGESETVEFPSADDEPVRLTFRKTRMLRYDTPGDLRPDIQGDEPFTLSESRWIMR